MLLISGINSLGANMKVSLVLTILVLLVVAWFVVQSVLLIFEAFFKAGGEGSNEMRIPTRPAGNFSALGAQELNLDKHGERGGG
jgi:hypothetical protein